MGRILLLSDTHGYMGEEILQHAKQADEVWHAGDIGNIEVIDALEQVAPLRAVFGNIDGQPIRSMYPEDLIFEYEKAKVYMTHIAGYPGRYTPHARNIIDTSHPSLVICGHSHILKVMQDQKRIHLHMNPGAIGKHGFHQVRTMLQFEINSGKIGELVVIEFKR